MRRQKNTGANRTPPYKTRRPVTERNTKNAALQHNAIQKTPPRGIFRGAARCPCVCSVLLLRRALFPHALRKLRIVQVAVEPALFHELRVRALFDDRAVLHDEDEVGV